jgi:S1-C subfamily serine protease
MSSTRQARPGALAGILLLAAGAAAASTDEAMPDALPVAEITARGAPAVVLLRVKVTAERQVSYGSGFLVDPGGTIVTALHMVDRADQVLVRTADGKRFRRVTVRSYDVASDVAVLQIDGADLPVVTLGGTSELRSGPAVRGAARAHDPLSPPLPPPRAARVHGPACRADGRADALTPPRAPPRRARQPAGSSAPM